MFMVAETIGCVIGGSGCCVRGVAWPSKASKGFSKKS